MSQLGSGEPLISVSKPWLRTLPAATEYIGLFRSPMARLRSTIWNSAACALSLPSMNAPFKPVSIWRPTRGDSVLPCASMSVCGWKMLV
ncbi:hypothetical protein D3C78_1522830 [compost metagenome]